MNAKALNVGHHVITKTSSFHVEDQLLKLDYTVLKTPPPPHTVINRIMFRCKPDTVLCL